MASVLGAERRAAACRELTKLYETTYYGTLGELALRATQDADLARGELVLVVAGSATVAAAATALDAEQLLSLLLEDLPASQAAKLAARICGGNRAQLYDLAVQRKTRPE